MNQSVQVECLTLRVLICTSVHINHFVTMIEISEVTEFRVTIATNCRVSTHYVSVSCVLVYERPVDIECHGNFMDIFMLILEV
jgi:hypothetical protein